MSNLNFGPITEKMLNIEVQGQARPCDSDCPLYQYHGSTQKKDCALKKVGYDAYVTDDE